jgi:hypothetical protein
MILTTPRIVYLEVSAEYQGNKLTTVMQQGERNALQCSVGVLIYAEYAGIVNKIGG